MKKCSKCFLQKDLNSFSRKGTKKDGSVRYESQCKQCKAKMDSLRYKKKQVLKKTMKLEKPSSYKFKFMKASSADATDITEVIKLCMEKMKTKI